jgi:hypothetical protein
MKPLNKTNKTYKKKLKISPFVWIGAALVAIVLMTLSFNVDLNPIGEKVEVMPDRYHVSQDSDPGPYSTNPPTSGRHYAEHFTSEFFDVNTYAHPEGFLVHNLEHGYVIFWYNCDLLSQDQCVQLKAEIKGVMEKAKMNKVIAFPWPSIDAPVVITSWGRMLRMEKFDPDLAFRYVSKYRNHSPEPQGE